MTIRDPAGSASRRILVTGARGFVGRLVFRALAEAGVEPGEIFEGVHGDDRSAPENPNSVPIDVTDRARTRAVIESVRPTGIIHLAAISEPALARENPEAAWAVNFGGVRNVVDAAIELVPDVPIVFSGSSEAYGASFRGSPDPVREDIALMPMNDYAATKAASDLYLGQKSRAGANIFRFRPFNHSGPGQTTKFVVPAFASQIARIDRGLQAPVIDVGNLDVERDFLDGRDVARAYVEAVLSERPAGEDSAFNLATGAPVRIRAILDALVAMSDRNIEIRIDPARVRPVEFPRISGDPSFTAQRLGWRPRIPLAETLGSVLRDWHQRIRE